MTQEEADFIFFKNEQLKNVDFATGILDVYIKDKFGNKTRSAYDVGSRNQDGYIRLWCNRRLRMKHRLLFWLYHGYLPLEVDHINKQRDDNVITNLQDATRSQNTTNKVVRNFKQLTEQEVRDLSQIIAQGDYTITRLSQQFGRSRTQIKAILCKKYWSHVTDQYF